MTLKIKINKPESQLPVQATVSLQASKTLAGNIIIKDHEKLDIVIVPSTKKILTIPKPGINEGENIYEFQSDILHALYESGVVEFETIQGGPSFGVLEGTYSPSEDVDSVQVILFEVDKYIKKMSADTALSRAYDEYIEDRFTDPTDEDSTALGEIKPEQDTGDTYMTPAYSYAGQGYLY
jgi:hypothetical protein